MLSRSDGLGELIIEMDTICDEQGYPQKDTELRSLITRSNAKTLPQKETETSIRIGKLQKLSLPVCIMMRQNSSMQGFLQYTGEKICFRSSLELMRMLHEDIKTK